MTFYLVLMFTVFPLYMPEGFVRIGDFKFLLYRIITAITVVMGVSIMVMLFAKRAELLVGVGDNDLRQAEGLTKKSLFTIPGMDKKNLCTIYGAICVYLCMSLISFIFSLNKTNAFWGFPGWNMGLFTRVAVLLVFLLLLVFYKDSPVVWLSAFAGSSITFMLAVLNRFGIYPIKTYSEDPEFISTIGQTNWFCGYMICFVAMGVGFFSLHEFSDKQRIAIDKHSSIISKHRVAFGAALFLYNLLASAALWVSGSDSALLISAIIYLVILRFAITDRDKLMRYFATLLGFFLIPEVLNIFTYVILQGEFRYFQEDDFANQIIKSHVCIVPVLLVAAVLLCLKKQYNGGDSVLNSANLVAEDGKADHNKEKDINLEGYKAYKVNESSQKLISMSNQEWSGCYNALRLIYRIFVVAIILCIMIVVFLIYKVTTTPETMGKLSEISFLRFDDSWGTWRGMNWRASIIGFSGLPALRKLVGVGTGCFYDYMYSLKETLDIYNTYVHGEVMANAHNDYLTGLVETGIEGVLSTLALYIAIAVSLFRKAIVVTTDVKSEQNRIFVNTYAVIALSALIAYAINLIVSFQTVVSTPYIFIFAAIALNTGGSVLQNKINL